MTGNNMETKFYKRKVDNGWANQILEVENGVFGRLTFEELGNGYHYGFVPNDYEEGKQIPKGFFSKYGFKQFYPSNNFLNARFQEMEMDFEQD